MGESISIVVVDDDEEMREVVGRFLKKRDLPVKLAKDAADCLHILNGDHVDLVLCDIEMPEMDGVELAREIKMLRPMTQIMMMTAHSNMMRVVESVGSGLAVDYFVKPLDWDAFEGAVRECLRRAERWRDGFRIKATLSQQSIAET